MEHAREGGGLSSLRAAGDPLLDPGRIWPRADAVAPFDLRVFGDDWQGPLIVSMPRTGSTLLGLLLLFAESGGPSTPRYVHEPAAPMFWEGSTLADAISFVDPPFGPGDVVQDSAYQFTHPDVACWFVERARRPIVFTVRHPQLAWPSRWRALLGQLVDEQPDHPIAARARAALQADDFSAVGDHLAHAVAPPDNGVLALDWLLEHCRHESIDHVIVDNGRFRSDPGPILEDLCDRLGLTFTPAMVEWTDLSSVLPRMLMSKLASGEEFDWYYASTVGSTRGIEPERRPLLDLDRFPPELRGEGGPCLTIDEAIAWYDELLTRPEALG